MYCAVNTSIALVISTLYQSRYRSSPSSHDGEYTRPSVLLRENSGASVGLPPTVTRISWLIAWKPAGTGSTPPKPPAQRTATSAGSSGMSEAEQGSRTGGNESDWPENSSDT